ncbi:MAG: hypothetical protein WKF30_03070 [Pyrinomonadaceae bacterium]
MDDYYAQLNGLAHQALFVSDRGFDVRPYFIAARKFDYEYFCFLNSYSVLLDADWLSKMHQHVAQRNVGLVGATSSYESHYSNASSGMNRGTVPFSIKQILKNYLIRRQVKKYELNFDPFPNYHIRTNAFMLSRKLMLGLKIGAIRSKMDAFKFESGKKGLTCQILALGLKALVVGRDGKAYEKDRWYESHTFRSGDQRNLLIADNQTRQYLMSDVHRRKALSEDTWGKQPGQEQSGCIVG